MIYNEHDAFAAEWLRNLIKHGLIPQGVVDGSDIQEITAAEVAGQSFHAFAGIGGWPLALRLAGWPDDRPIWTGSCPCQPFSAAGKRKGEADERHIWPVFFRLIDECRPAICIGEQVASKDGLRWLDGVRADLEGAGYAVGASDLCVAGSGTEAEGWIVRGDQADWERIIVGAPHIRQRLFWVAISEHGGRSGRESQRRRADTALPSSVDGLGVANGTGPQQGWPTAEGERHRNSADAASGDGRVVGLRNSIGAGLAGRQGEPGHDGPQLTAAERTSDDAGGLGEPETQGRSRILGQREHELSKRPRPDGSGAWNDFRIIPCTDGKARRSQSSISPLAHGVPSKRSDARLGQLLAELVKLGFSAKDAGRIVREARSNRVGRLKGYWNSVSPPITAMFIRSVMEIIDQK